MEYKDFITTLAQRIGVEREDTEAMMGGFCRIVTERCVQQDTVSIQGLGSFEARKKMERVSVNPTTGQRMLIPPKVVMVFKPSSVIKSKLKEKK